MSKEDYYVKSFYDEENRTADDEKNFHTDSAKRFQIVMERYQRYKMGDYCSNRLFCIGEKLSVQPVSDGGYYRLPMSGMRTYQGGG